MNELSNGRPSTVPRTFTSPRVPKNSAELGHTTYVQPPVAGLFRRVSSNSARILCSVAMELRLLAWVELIELV
jgi:hypothetical protein